MRTVPFHAGGWLIVVTLAQACAAQDRARSEPTLRGRDDVLFFCDFESDDWFREWGVRQRDPHTDTVAADAARKFAPLRGKALRIARHDRRRLDRLRKRSESG